MKDISYHVLDIAQNSLSAGATEVWIELIEKTEEGTLILILSDNGKGMNVEQLNHVTDAFFTTSAAKKVGLGIPLLKQNAELTGGSLRINSQLNKGTQVVASFHTGNLDMIPLGDMAMTIRLLVASNPGIEFKYRHSKDNRIFEMDTTELRKELGDIRINQKEVLDYITNYICSSLKDISVNSN